jgi:selenide,water dikinase
VFVVGQRLGVGDLLAHNLRRHVGGGELKQQPPPGRTLELISCGSRRAIAAWGGLTIEGRWVAWWKERRERRHRLTGRAGGAR